MSHQQPLKKRSGGSRHAPAKRARDRTGKAKATAARPELEVVALNPASLPGAHANPAERLPPSEGFFARVPLGIAFRIDRTQIHTIGQSKAADLAAVKQRVLLAEGPFRSARSDFAKILQAEPSALPIVWLQASAEEVVVALLPPGDVELASLNEVQLASVDALAKHWRQVTEKLERGDCPTKEDQARRNPRAAKGKRTEDQQLEPSAARLEYALRRGTQTHGVEVSLICNGKFDDGPAKIINAQPARPPASPRLAKAEVIIAHIEHITGDGTCELRSRGARRKQFAEFSASGALAAQLALTCGCPEVYLKVRRYVFDESERRPAVDFRIEEIVALSPAWFQGSPTVFEHLQGCIDSLRSLPQGGSVVQQSLP